MAACLQWSKPAPWVADILFNMGEFLYLTTFLPMINFGLLVKDYDGFRKKNKNIHFTIVGKTCLWWTIVLSFTLRTELSDTNTIKILAP